MSEPKIYVLQREENGRFHHYVLREDYEALAAQCAEQAALIESLQNRWASRPLSVEDTAALERENEELRKDAARLRFLAVGPDESNPGPMLCDEFCGTDLHDQASIYASALGREEANADDYLAAWRDACDAAMTPLADSAR